MGRHTIPRRAPRPSVTQLIAGLFAACAGISVFTVIGVLIIVGVGITIIAVALGY